MASKGLGIEQTKGTFQFKGIVSGVRKDTFYKETKTKTNKPFRAISFGLQVAKDSIVYVSLNGMEQENVYFSKTVEKKTTVEKVAWSKRLDWNKEGFRLIGVNVGVEKTTDEKGNLVNVKKYLTPFDACDYIAKHLKDDSSVFVRGNIEYFHFESNGNTSHSVKFIPTQISLCKDVDFDIVDYEVVSSFSQVLVYMGIRKENERGLVDAKVVNYSTIEDAEFVIDDPKLAGNFKKLKSNTGIKVWGNIKTVRNTEPVQDKSTDGWGGPNPMDKVTSPYKRELIITGADPTSIDTVVYAEDVLEQAMEAMKSDSKAKTEYGDDDWGETPSETKEVKEEESAW